MKTLTILVGFPASGKSTYADQNEHDTCKVVSSDNYLEKLAKSHCLTYNDIWKTEATNAQRHCSTSARICFDKGIDVIWDQTNLTKKKRAKILAMTPKDYKKLVLVFRTSRAERDRRAACRIGKHIPKTVIDQMETHFEYPELDEGFDTIVEMKT